MKLALKFAVILFTGICAVLAVEAYFTCLWEIDIVQTDMNLDHKVIGKSLAAGFDEIKKLKDENAAIKFVQNAGTPATHVYVNWIWDDEASGHASVSTGTKDPPVTEKDYVLTPYPVSSATSRPGHIQIAESRDEEWRRIRSSIRRVLETTGVVAVVLGGLAALVGAYFVGRPTARLVARAQRVGEGDLATRLDFRQRDEFGTLARELNAMCEHLAEARDKLAAETAVKIATLEQLRRADRLATVGKLASGIAHEMGTPLNVVWARGKMVASSAPAGSDLGQNGRIIAEQSEHMTKIIRQLLDFARPRPPKKAKTDLLAIARAIEALLRPMARKRKVEVAIDTGAGPIEVEVDAGQIQQVLTNLIVNAIHAMPTGGTARISATSVTARSPADRGGREGRYLRLDIEDQGVGISDESKVHLFEPFFTTKGVGEGTGLGLSVSLGIVREHGGWIDVESSVGKGSKFSVYLPL